MSVRFERCRQLHPSAKPRTQMLDRLEDLQARCGDKAGAHARCIIEILASVESYNERINSEVTWHIASDDELLAKIETLLAPNAGSQPGLINTVNTFRNDALKPMLTHELHHFRERSVGCL